MTCWANKSKYTVKIENTMEFTDLYTVESLQCFNGFHNRGYRVNRSDTDKVNRLIATIRQEREKNIGPVAGDSIEYTCRNGDWFHSAHIEDLRNGHLKSVFPGAFHSAMRTAPVPAIMSMKGYGLIRERPS